ncbi:sulfite transporter Ssu1 [Fusarium austroafricanum]|uniref:Sulfite transporter Ssu1 n=1 Tax=Fusarium austroafricanum TaxID=2364996 RepID=A0A8H4JNC0_9HYPO|nr:sulfite transporter Ssu1 [Fusarium austroafricanum]
MATPDSTSSHTHATSYFPPYRPRSKSEDRSSEATLVINPHSPAEFYHNTKDIKGAPARMLQCFRVFLQALTPSWFTTSMGTGIVSILLHNIPYNSNGLYWGSVVIFLFNTALFVMLSFFSILRYALYPGLWTTMIHHPTAPMYLAAIPMALGTLIEMIVLVCVPLWGDWVAYLCWGLWWVDSAMAIILNFGLLFLIMTIHDSHPSQVTAIWLLPMASTIVASAVGGVIAEVLPNPCHALWTLVVSYVLWGTALPLLMSFLVIYLYRLTMYQIPPKDVIASSLIPVAPLGQGAFAILKLGKVAATLMSKMNMLDGKDTQAGTILYVLGWFTGLVLWSYGLCWLIIAIASLVRRQVFFNLGCWAFTFPLGVWANAAISFGNELPLPFFKIVGTILAAIVTFLWVLVSAYTLRGMYTGQIFVAPDFDEWRKQTGSYYCKSNVSSVYPSRSKNQSLWAERED